MLPGREEVYSGTLDMFTLQELNEAGMEVTPDYTDADVTISLEYQEDDDGDMTQLTAVLEGPETTSLLNPFNTYRPEETYNISHEEAEEIRSVLEG
ncbi:MAG: hypothetical protein ABEJ62_02195 [Candidatus Nanohaloarchaea archaeon]